MPEDLVELECHCQLRTVLLGTFCGCSQCLSSIQGLWDLCCIMNFCSLSLCSCLLFSFDWGMNSRKWITSHRLNSKHRLLSILITVEHYRQHETSFLPFWNFSALSWKQVAAVMKNWQNRCKICSTYFTYLFHFGNQCFYFQEAWAHITSYHSGGLKTVNEGYVF